MNSQKSLLTSSNINHQTGGLLLNVGIGIVLGLLAALLAVFLVMRGGPFKDNANKNALEQPGQSTDPNAPLYGPSIKPIDPSLLNASPTDVPTALTTDTKMGSNTTDTAKSTVGTNNTSDPIGEMIGSVNNTKTETVTTTKKETSSTKPVETPKVTTGVSTNSSLPKEVKPTTAPNTPSPNDTLSKSGQYTIQAGAFNSAAEAAALKSKLAAQGQKAIVTEKKTEDGTLYRVRVGNYNSDKEAQAARAKLGGVVLEIGK